MLNLLWTVYSILMLGAALGVASEARQVRRMHRVATRLQATLYQDDGTVFQAVCIDFSMTGVGLELPEGTRLAVGEKVQVGLWRGHIECTFPATIMLHRGQGATGLQFDPMTREQQIDLVQCTFARPDTWRQWNDSHDIDRPLHGLQEIAQLGVLGYRKFWESLLEAARSRWPTGSQRKQQGLGA